MFGLFALSFCSVCTMLTEVISFFLVGTSRLRNDNGSQSMFSRIVGWKLNLLLKALARAGREKQHTDLVVL